MDDDRTADLDLRDYLRVLWRHKMAIIVSVLVCTSLAALLSARQPKIYEATAEVLLTSAANSGPGSGGVDDTQVATEIAVVQSGPIGAAVQDQLGSDAGLVGGVTASRVGNTRVIAIHARSEDPVVAQRAANATADVYVKQRLERALANVDSLRKETQTRLDDTRDQIDQLDEQIAAESAKSSPSQTVIDGLTTQRDALTAQLLSLQQRLGDLQIDSSLNQAGAEVLSTAGVPGAPVSPRPKRNLVLGALLGLIVGVAIAFMREATAGRANREDDITRVLPSIPVLARIPTLEPAETRGDGALFAVEAPSSPPAEAARLLHVNLQFTALDRPLRSLLVTSASSSEGKTTVAANLAATVARSGKNVVLVDCDLRRPGVAEIMGVPNDTGLTTVLLGRARLEDALQSVPVEGFRALRVLTAGVAAPNPAELLATKQLTDLVGKLSADADLVIIDAPPVVPVADALVLSQHVDGVLLVARLGTSKPKAIAQADALLRRAEAQVVGVVLNEVSVSGDPYFMPEPKASRSSRPRRDQHR